MPYKLAAESFSRQFCSILTAIKVHFYSKHGHCVFEHPFGGLEATYAAHLRLIEKRVVDFLLVIIELFFAMCYSEALRANVDWKSPFLKRWVNLVQNFRQKGHSPPTIFRLAKADASLFRLV